MFWNQFRDCTTSVVSITFPISGLVAALRPYLPRKYPISKVIEVLICDWLATKTYAWIDSPLLTPTVNLAESFYRKELASSVGEYNWGEIKKLFNAAAEHYVGESIDSSGWWLEHSSHAIHITYRRIFIDQKLKTLDEVLDDIRTKLTARGVADVEFIKQTHLLRYRAVIPPDGNYDRFLTHVSGGIFESVVQGRQDVHSRTGR